MNVLVKGVHGKLDRVIGKDIRLSSRLSSEACVVLADPGQNRASPDESPRQRAGRDAEGGELVILTERMPLDGGFCLLG
jgi:hypothetical protein